MLAPQRCSWRTVEDSVYVESSEHGVSCCTRVLAGSWSYHRALRNTATNDTHETWLIYVSGSVGSVLGSKGQTKWLGQWVAGSRETKERQPAQWGRGCQEARF
jgi:hypothetical protein